MSMIAFAAALAIWPGNVEKPPRDWVALNSQVNTIDRRSAPLASEGDDDNTYDCEDYAWTKYRALQALGVSKERMKLFAVTVANGQRHMILVADGWVLDNLEPRLEPEDKARRYYRDWQDRTNPQAVIVIP